MNIPVLSPDYEIVRLIDSGGQADVYEVRHCATGGRYAARVLRDSWDPLAREAFGEATRRQLRAAGPRIVPIVAYDLDAKPPFAILEYMPRGTLADALRRRAVPFALPEGLLIARSLAEGLAYIHAMNVAHLDVKPGNALANAHGGWSLTDFGSSGTVGPRDVLWAKHCACTPPYAAPELLRGQKTQACDLYSLGIVLHELLTGARTVDSQALSERVGRCGPELAVTVARLSAADPRDRPTAREAVKLLSDIRERVVAVRPVLPLLRVPAFPKVGATSGPSPSFGFGDFLALLGLGAVGVAGVAALNRTTKSWDPLADRYRGADGKFRGAGLFE